MTGTQCTLTINLMQRSVIVWSESRSTFQVEGHYTDHADGKALLYQAKRKYPGHDVERVTFRTLEQLEAAA